MEVSFITRYPIPPNLLKLCILVNLFMIFRMLSLNNFTFFKMMFLVGVVPTLYSHSNFLISFIYFCYILTSPLCSFLRKSFCCLVPYLYIYLNLIYHPPVARINIKSPRISIHKVFLGTDFSNNNLYIYIYLWLTR